MSIETITAASYLKLLESDKAITAIDVRSTAEFNTEYLPGCKHLALQDFNQQSLQRLVAGLTTDVVYLLCGTGQRAFKAAEQLGENQLRLVVVEGGLSAIKNAGQSLQKGNSSVIPLERQVRIAAGSLVLLGAILGSTVAPAFYALSAFVGAGLVFAGVTNTCGMALLLARMPWNK